MAAAYYYIDNTNGNDARTGLRIPAGDQDSTSYYTVDETDDGGTYLKDADLVGLDVNGSYVYNVTRTTGSLISGFVALTGTATLAVAIPAMDVGDEYYILNAWQTIPKYTTTSVRTAGDKAYVRANQTHTLAAVCAFDEDGTVDLRISLIGCNATQSIDPWRDTSDVRPIITGAGNAYYLSIITDDYWYLANLDIIGGTGQYTAAAPLPGCLQIKQSTGVYVYNCIFRDCSGISSTNLMLFGATNCVLDTCAFTNSKLINVLSLSQVSDTAGADAPYGCSNIRFVNCTFDSGANATVYGFAAFGGNSIFFDGCNFGGSATHATSDLRITTSFVPSHPLTLYFRNTIFNSTKITWGTTGYAVQGVKLFEEDTNQVFGESVTTYYYGTITKVTHPVRVGGATSCAYMVPITGVGIYNPLSLTNDFLPDFRVWCASGAQTITVYILSETTWGGVYPTSAQLYLEAEYVTSDTTSAITRAKVVSTEVLGAANVHGGAETWLALTCAINPHVASFVNLKVNLCKFVAGNGVYVDIAPTIT